MSDTRCFRRRIYGLFLNLILGVERFGKFSIPLMITGSVLLIIFRESWGPSPDSKINPGGRLFHAASNSFFGNIAPYTGY